MRSRQGQQLNQIQGRKLIKEATVEWQKNETFTMHNKKTNTVIRKSPFSVLFDEEAVQLELGASGKGILLNTIL